MRWALLLVLLPGCSLDAESPALVEQVSPDIERVHNQEAVWQLQRELYMETYPETIVDIAQAEGRLRVFWVDQACPQRPDRNGIITPDGACLGGYMQGCRRIFVATNQDRPGRTCGTELVHEYGHCQLYLARGTADSDHRDYNYWERHLKAVRAIQCARDW